MNPIRPSAASDRRLQRQRQVATAGVVALLALLVLVGGALAAKKTSLRHITNVVVPRWIANAVNAPDREPEDRALDKGRQPGKILAFFQLRPGQRVAELGVGTGTTTELLARVVGPRGRVYGQNPPFVLRRFAEKPWSARLKKAVMKNVVRLDRPFDDPFPASVTKLDAVLNVLFYHDTYWQRVDRAKMNRSVFRALKRGGIYGIVDHAAKKGRGSLDTQTLHRVEKSLVIKEIQAAGFVLIADATFLQNPKDARDWNAAPRASGKRRGTSDRFVLLFVKP